MYFLCIETVFLSISICCVCFLSSSLYIPNTKVVTFSLFHQSSMLVKYTSPIKKNLHHLSNFISFEASSSLFFFNLFYDSMHLTTENLCLMFMKFKYAITSICLSIFVKCLSSAFSNFPCKASFPGPMSLCLFLAFSQKSQSVNVRAGSEYSNEKLLCFGF